ncbi:hypothetical protein ACV242_003210 [Peribacillus simplex]
MPIKRQKALASSRKTEYGIYGLLAANGLGEAATGKDMFGNQLTEEQRQNGLLMALGIGGVAGAAKVADKVASGTKFVPYSKEFAQKQVQKVQATITDIARSGKTTLKNIGDELGKKEIPKRISVEQVSLAGGPTLRQVMMEKQTIKEAYQKFTVKDSKVEGVSGESISNGIDNVKPGDKSSLAPGGGLAVHESRGGHLIERHVGKTDEELLERIRNNPRITGSSTFIDRPTAEKVVFTVLKNPKNIEKIQKWLSEPNSRPTLPLRYKGDGEIIGRSVSRNSEVVENVTNAKIVLKKDSNGNFILTGYPEK